MHKNVSKYLQVTYCVPEIFLSILQVVAHFVLSAILRGCSMFPTIEHALLSPQHYLSHGLLP